MADKLITLIAPGSFMESTRDDVATNKVLQRTREYLFSNGWIVLENNDLFTCYEYQELRDLTDDRIVFRTKEDRGINNMASLIKRTFSLIDASESIYVVNNEAIVDDYMRLCINHATSQGKSVQYMIRPDDLMNSDITCIKYRYNRTSSYPIVTLCGSLNRFSHIFPIVEKKLTTFGFVIFTPMIKMFTKEELQQDDRIHEILDKIHTIKISMSQCVLIVDGKPGTKSYIGNDTKREIQYCLDRSIRVFYTSSYGMNSIISEFKNLIAPGI